MRSMSSRGMTLTGLLGAMLLTVGCTSTTRVNFNGPPGSVLTIDDKPHHLPATVELSRPGGSSGSSRHDAGLVFNLPGQPGEVRATGFIDVFGYNESDVDRVAVNTCNLDEAQLARIKGGTTVIFKGQSASRQPLYDLTLSRK
jgi:hypothetical protein